MKNNNHKVIPQDEFFNLWAGSGEQDDALTNELVLADEVPTDPIRCPKCNGTTISVEGYYRLAFTIEQADGSVPKENLDDEGIKVVEVLTCPSCQIRWYVVDEATFRLYEENHELRVQVAILESLLHAPVRIMGESN
jgi:hypothetical protein